MASRRRAAVKFWARRPPAPPPRASLCAPAAAVSGASSTSWVGTTAEMCLFNVKDGFLEAVVRGYKQGLLTAADYNNLCQCESLDDIKLYLTGTDYGPFVADEASPLHTTTIVDCCTRKLVADWKYLRENAGEPLARFLDYCTYGHMIDNVVLIVTGTLHDRDVQTLTSDDLDEMNIEIMRNTLYKAYLDDFARFVASLGGSTKEVVGELLAFEADRRALNITLNSIGTELTRDDRRKLYANFGLLFPHGQAELAVADDFDAIRAAMEKCPPYASIFGRLGVGEAQMLDKVLYEEEVRQLMLTFTQQFHYGVFYAYMRLREQEIRNLMWIAECVAQDQKARITDGIVYTF
eukprot:scaffold17.g552.t1